MSVSVPGISGGALPPINQANEPAAIRNGDAAAKKAYEVGRSGEQGSIQQTGRSLDVAIQGPGYIEVRRPDGTIGLTRNGALQTNAKGQLTNGQGMAVQPPITIPPGTDPSNVTIQGNGNVVVNGKTLGQIKLVDVPAPNGLVADGDSIFSATAASGAIRTATGSTLQQNALEAESPPIRPLAPLLSPELPSLAPSLLGSLTVDASSWVS